MSPWHFLCWKLPTINASYFNAVMNAETEAWTQDPTRTKTGAIKTWNPFKTLKIFELDTGENFNSTLAHFHSRCSESNEKSQRVNVFFLKKRFSLWLWDQMTLTDRRHSWTWMDRHVPSFICRWKQSLQLWDTLNTFMVSCQKQQDEMIWSTDVKIRCSSDDDIFLFCHQMCSVCV